MSPFPVSSAPISATPVAADPAREKLTGAAQHFEAIFVRQMLAEARKTHFGGDELFGGQALDTFRQMQDERFADIAAQRGAFGLAKMIEAQLAAQVAQTPPRNGEGDHAEGSGGGVEAGQQHPSVSPAGAATSPSRGGFEAPGEDK